MTNEKSNNSILDCIRRKNLELNKNKIAKKIIDVSFIIKMYKKMKFIEKTLYSKKSKLLKKLIVKNPNNYNNLLDSFKY